MKDTIKYLRSIIRNAPNVSKPFTVYRGEEIYGPFFAEDDDVSPEDSKTTAYKVSQLNLQNGHTYDAVGFNSFSFAPWIATGFSGRTVCCLYRLKIEPKDNVPYLIYPLSQLMAEFEVLIPPSKFRVVGSEVITSPLSPQITMKVYDIEYVKELK